MEETELSFLLFIYLFIFLSVKQRKICFFSTNLSASASPSNSLSLSRKPNDTPLLSSYSCCYRSSSSELLTLLRRVLILRKAHFRLCQETRRVFE
uniref:Uncharacterized protein n=1 Tax=Salix viminalis TaxID=40686 RepID=A0A6N2ME61_SALVM